MGVRCISDREQYRRGAAALAVALLLVLAIALLQRWGVLTPANRAIMTAAGRARDSDLGGMVTPIMQFASLIGGTTGRFVLLAMAAIGLFRAGRRRGSIWLVLVVLGGTLLNLALKQLFAAPRPDLLPHLDIVHTYSFPSGHAAGNLVFFGAVAMLIAGRIGWIGAMICAAIIGLSRIWLGVHWPSDVAAGWVEAVGWLIFCATWLAPLDTGRHRSYRTATTQSEGQGS